MSAVVSPCRKVCTLDPARTRCTACGRTLDEIARWGAMTDAERQAIMDDLPARLTSWGNTGPAATG